MAGGHEFVCGGHEERNRPAGYVRGERCHKGRLGAVSGIVGRELRQRFDRNPRPPEDCFEIVGVALIPVVICPYIQKHPVSLAWKKSRIRSSLRLRL